MSLTIGASTPSTSVNAFEAFVEQRGGSLSELTVRTGLAAMLSFYGSVFPAGCSAEAGDMLLFQWGTYDWCDGARFEINITRQFIESAAEDDDAISQLKLTFKFRTDEQTAAFGNGNHWCNSRLDVHPFRELIFSNQAFVAKADADPPDVSLRHEYV